jgi:argininosuccinate lyase
VLVTRGTPFREAHDAVGRLVAALSQSGRTLVDLTAEDLDAAHPMFEAGDVSLADASESLQSRATPRSGSASSVAEQIAAIGNILARDS